MAKLALEEVIKAAQEYQKARCNFLQKVMEYIITVIPDIVEGDSGQ